LADQEKEGGPKCKTSGPHKLCQMCTLLEIFKDDDSKDKSYGTPCATV